MMEERKHTDHNVWKQALERRQAGDLPSNFSFRAMERIRLEAGKRQKRAIRLGWVALVASSVSLLGLGVYFLCFYLNIRITDYLPKMDIPQDAFLFKFYGSIAILALVLLGLDYWLRKKYIWK